MQLIRGLKVFVGVNSHFKWIGADPTDLQKFILKNCVVTSRMNPKIGDLKHCKMIAFERVAVNYERFLLGAVNPNVIERIIILDCEVRKDSRFDPFGAFIKEKTGCAYIACWPNLQEIRMNGYIGSEPIKALLIGILVKK